MEATPDMIRLLKENMIFQEFTETDLEKILPFIHDMHLGVGDVIVHQGDLGNEFYIIQEGEVEVIKKTGIGDRVHQLTVLHQGDNFGELVLVGNGYRSASVRALRPTTLLVLSTDLLSPEINELHLILSMYKGLAQQLSDRLRSTNEAMTLSIAREQTKTHSRLKLDIVLTVIIISIALFTFYIGMTVGSQNAEPAAANAQKVIIE